MIEHSKFATQARTVAWVSLLTALAILFACTPVSVSLDCSKSCDELCSLAKEACEGAGSRFARKGACNTYPAAPDCPISCAYSCDPPTGPHGPQFDMDVCTL